MKELETYRIPDAYTDHMDRLRVYLADVALREVMELTDEWISRIEKDLKTLLPQEIIKAVDNFFEKRKGDRNA